MAFDIFPRSAKLLPPSGVYGISNFVEVHAMFTFRPGNGKNGTGHKPSNGNGHSAVNGHRNGNGNGHPEKIESVLGPGLHYSGSLMGAGGARIEGSFEGQIKLGGPLVIAEGAKVTCEHIEAAAVSVAGTVKGNITAAKVELLSTGRIYGDLTTTAFASEEGAFLRGQIVMQDQTPEPA
jgi:cytoskeletal protein CcmA (bactofilin family)